MLVIFFFFNQKTAYEMRISDWSSDVCSSDLVAVLAEFAVLAALHVKTGVEVERAATAVELRAQSLSLPGDQIDTVALDRLRSEERRVGNACVSKFRSRWSPLHSNKKRFAIIIFNETNYTTVTLQRLIH